MRRISILLIFIVLAVSATAFTPQNNIDLLNFFGIYNLTNMTGGSITLDDTLSATTITLNGTNLSASSSARGATGPYLSDDGTNHSFNESLLNLTIDARSSDTRWSIDGLWIFNSSGSLSWNLTSGDNRYYNKSIADSQFIAQSDESTLNVNSSNNSNASTYWGNFLVASDLDNKIASHWDNITNKFITAVGDIYINMVGTTATFNESQLNDTIDLRDKTNTSVQMIAATNGAVNSTSWNRNGTRMQKANSGDIVCFNSACTFFINSTCIVYPSGGQDCTT
jgi:hypothetical protein